MLDLIRGGPKMLIFESSRIEELKDYFIQSKNAYAYSYDDTFEKAGEEHTIIFITDKMEDIVDRKRIKEVLMIAEEPDVILCGLLNDGKGHLVTMSRISTRIIILSAMGDPEKAIREISEDYECIEGDIIEILNSYNEKGTVIAISGKPIHGEISIKRDIYKRALFVEEKYRPLMRSLRPRALKYLNSSLGNKDWYEIEIRIFDQYGKYDLHHERLLNIIEWLEIGLVLGESWGKDYPRPMLAVEVYRIRLFTYHDPKYIKKILIGLEFLDDGTRIIDYDLYFNRKKLYWTEVADKGVKERHLLGAKYREEILSKLRDKEVEELYGIENDILATRK